MKKNTFLLLSLGTLIFITGCSSFYPEKSASKALKTPTPLPYAFQVESFLDRRPVQGEKTLLDVLNPRPQKEFDQQLFLNSLVRRMNGNPLFDHQSATLRIELKDYAGFKDDFEHTVSFYTDITAFDVDGRVLATGIFSCFSKEDSRLRHVGKLRKFFRTDQDPQEKSVQKEDIWKDLYTSCLNDIAYEFNAKVLEWHQRRR